MHQIQHYILVVQAIDGGVPALSSTVTVYCNVVDLNDNSPVFENTPHVADVMENVTVGSSVLSLLAQDLDSGNNGKVRYSIVSGDDNGDLAIAANGTITVRKPLDRETKSMYNLIIDATDSPDPPALPLKSTAQVIIILYIIYFSDAAVNKCLSHILYNINTITFACAHQVTIMVLDVNDVSPEFIGPKRASIRENVAINTVGIGVKAIDRDEGRSGYVEYFLDETSGKQTPFVLGQVDGLLRVSDNLDRETMSNYTLKITARDRGDPPRSTTTVFHVTILDENDNSPVFNPRQYSATVAENASIGASVLQVYVHNYTYICIIHFFIV